MAQAVMVAGLPIWMFTALMREAPVLDPIARLGAGLVLAGVAFLIFWALISAMFVDVPLRAGRSIVSLAGAFAAFLIVVATLTPERMRTYLGILLFAMALSGFLSLVAYFEPNLREIIFMGSDRSSGFFKNPNQFGITLSTVTPVAIGYVFTREGRRTGWVICAALLILGLILAGSKANLLLSAINIMAVVVAVAIVSFTGPKRVWMVFGGLTLTVLFLASGLFVLHLLNPRALELLQAFFSAEGELHSLNSREVLWDESLRQFLLHPLTGQGAGQPLNVFEGDRQVTHSHNVLLDYARTLGAPGLAVFGAVMATMVVLCLNTIWLALGSKGDGSPHDRILAFCLALGSLSYLAANFSSDSMGPSTSPFFWTVFFLCLAARSGLVSAGDGLNDRV